MYIYLTLHLIFILTGFICPLGSIAAEETTSLPPPQNEETDHFFYEFVKMIVILSVLIAMLLVMMWMFRRFMNARLEQLNSGSMVKVLERRALTAKTSLYVVEILDKKIVVAETHNGSSSLLELNNSNTPSSLG